MAAASIILSVLLITPLGPSRPVEDPFHDRRKIVQTLERIEERERIERQERREREASAAIPGYSPPVGGAPLCDSACIDCESSWDADAYNAAGYWGLYQYNYESWVSDGGNPDTYGSASAAEQHAVAANATFDRWPNC